MQNCPRFEVCDAPLCPLDPDLALRVWYAGEEDANVKFKVAAAMFPEYRWKMIRWKNKTIGWEIIKEV